MSWFYAKHGKQEGPVEEAELRSKLKSGEVGPDDLVWREGMAEWQPAGKIPELAPGAGGAVVGQAVSTLGAGPGGLSGSAPAGAAPQAGFVPGHGGPVMQQQPLPGMPPLMTPPPTSGLAIASMVCGIISLLSCYVWALVGIPAVVCGHLALKSINDTPHAVEGRGMAIAGLVTGYLAIVIQILAIVGLIVFWTSAT